MIVWDQAFCSLNQKDFQKSCQNIQITDLAIHVAKGMQIGPCVFGIDNFQVPGFYETFFEIFKLQNQSNCNR